MIIIEIGVSFTLLLEVLFFSIAAGGSVLVIRLNCYLKSYIALNLTNQHLTY